MRKLATPDARKASATASTAKPLAMLEKSSATSARRRARSSSSSMEVQGLAQAGMASARCGPKPQWSTSRPRAGSNAPSDKRATLSPARSTVRISAGRVIHPPIGCLLKRLMTEPASQLLICATTMSSTARTILSMSAGGSTIDADHVVPIVGPPKRLIAPWRCRPRNISGDRPGAIAMRGATVPVTVRAPAPQAS